MSEAQSIATDTESLEVEASAVQTFRTPADTSDVDVIIAAVHLAADALQPQVIDGGEPDPDVVEHVWFQLKIVSELLDRLRAKVEGGRARAHLSVIL